LLKIFRGCVQLALAIFVYFYFTFPLPYYIMQNAAAGAAVCIRTPLPGAALHSDQTERKRNGT
ncbi:MAG: hypothetical protein LUF81_03480, partial [Clostridiales bacterium]|nr:hypothetical protein [Clostridiales bacterium]